MHIARGFFLYVHFVLFLQIINSHPLDERTLMCACSAMVSLNLFHWAWFLLCQHQERELWPDPDWKSATHGLRSVQLKAWMTSLPVLKNWDWPGADQKKSWVKGLFTTVVLAEWCEGDSKANRLKMEKPRTPPLCLRASSILRDISRGF